MKIFNNLLVIFLLVFGHNLSAQADSGATVHGNSFSEVTDASQNWKVYEDLAVMDTVDIQLAGEIKEVCQAKGCWMKVTLDNKQEVFVKFKDYGFFVPTNVSTRKVAMNGLAFVEEMSVEEQRHYAKDEGASKEAIMKITKPKKTLRFEADGVIIKK